MITHRKIDRLYGSRLRSTLAKSGLDSHFLFIPEGERFKNLDTVQKLYDGLIRHRMRREDGLVALGGGVVGRHCRFRRCHLPSRRGLRASAHHFARPDR